MLIFIKFPTGKAVPLDVDAKDTIQIVKSKLAERESLGLPSAFKIAFKGKLLKEEETVAGSGIGTEATLHVVILPKPVEEEEKKTKSKSLPSKSFKSTHAKAETESVSDESASESDSEEEEEVKRPTTKTKGKTSEVSIPIPTDDLSPEEKEQLLLSFSAEQTSAGVEIVFSFDTTGSMSSCIAQVREKLRETVDKLLKDIGKIKIGIIAHGDYCDNTHAIEYVDLSSDTEALCKFVTSVQSTGGGDAPECYELALQVARTKMSWSKDTAKALVVIGDDVPHPPSYTTERINWRDEVKQLKKMGVKIYGVRAYDVPAAQLFYETLSEKTGTVSIKFSNFHLIVDMFLAICYREASPQKLQQFQDEVKKEGKMTEELGTIFETLSQPNPDKKPKEKKKITCNAPWYNTALDFGVPQYKRSGKGWVQYNSKIGRTSSFFSGLFKKVF